MINEQKIIQEELYIIEENIIYKKRIRQYCTHKKVLQRVIPFIQTSKIPQLLDVIKDTSAHSTRKLYAKVSKLELSCMLMHA